MKKNFRKLMALGLAFTMISSVSACGTSGSGEQTGSGSTGSSSAEANSSTTADSGDGSADLLDEIKDRGYMIVGTEGTWRPYTYHDEDGNLEGFDVEVAKMIADYIGVDIRYTESEWSSLFASLDAGQVDTIVNSVGYTDERAEKYDFSEPYNYAQYAILIAADNDEIKGLDDVKGKVAANNPTSTIGALAESSGCTLDDVGEMAQSISEVLNGRADVTFNTVASYTDYLNQHPENADKVKIITVTDPEPDAYVPVRKGNEKFLQAINDAIEAGQKDGTLSELADKYFGIDTTDPSGTQ